MSTKTVNSEDISYEYDPYRQPQWGRQEPAGYANAGGNGYKAGIEFSVFNTSETVRSISLLFGWTGSASSNTIFAAKFYDADPFGIQRTPFATKALSLNLSNHTASVVVSSLSKSLTRLFVEIYLYSGAGDIRVAPGSSVTLEYGEEPTPPGPSHTAPTVNTVTVTAGNSGLDPIFSGTFIAGYSYAQVAASVTAGDSTITSVKFSYPEYSGQISMSGSGGQYSGTSPRALTGSTTITVTATDANGLSGSKTVSVSVTPYTEPSVTIIYAERCDSVGNYERGGEYYQVNVLANYSSLNGDNSVQSLCVKAGTTAGSGTWRDITAGVTYRYHDTTNQNAVYILTFYISDKISSSQMSLSLAGKLRDVIFKRGYYNDSAHIGVGMTPNDYLNDSSIQLPPGGKIIIGGQDITAWLRQQIGGSW